MREAHFTDPPWRIYITEKAPFFRTGPLAPQVGLEPTTLRLTAECSAIELLRNVQMLQRLLYPCSILLESGDDLLSRAVSSQVPSACGGLTSVFGMGTGGSLQLLSPEILFSFLRTFKTAQPINFDLETFKLPFSDQALDRLVSSSFTCYHASTDDLSTLSSSRGLTCLKQWESLSSGRFHA